MNAVNGDFLDAETTLFILGVLVTGVTPAISILGVAGNVFSVLVLVKQGLGKSSNILLVVLAVSDIVFLISFNGERLIIYHVIYREGFQYIRADTSRNLIILFSIFSYFDYVSGSTSFTIPVLITIERLFAVLLPLSFRRIITPKRIWVTITFVCFLWLSVIAYPIFWLDVHFVFGPDNNSSTYLIERRPGFENDQSREVLETVVLQSTMILSPTLTASGCLVIAIKIRIDSAKRKKITSKEISSNRTTLTLLAVCACYTVTGAILSLPIFLSKGFVSTGFTDGNPSNMAKLMYQTMNIFGCINSSCNFVVYVGLNRRFRDMYKELFDCRRKKILVSSWT